MKKVTMTLPDDVVASIIPQIIDKVGYLHVEPEEPTSMFVVGRLAEGIEPNVWDKSPFGLDLDGAHRRQAQAEVRRARPDDQERGPDKKPRQSPRGSVKRRLSFGGKTTEELVIDALKNSPNQPVSYLQLKQVLVKAGFQGTTISGVLQRLKTQNKVVMPVNGYYRLSETRTPLKEKS